MASNGIRDRVAIVGMGCTEFGERWDKSAEDLLIDAATDALGYRGSGSGSRGAISREDQGSRCRDHGSRCRESRAYNRSRHALGRTG